MNPQKKVWDTPQLIILARGTPEENVLTVCKAIDFHGTPLAAGTLQQSNCGQEENKNCATCQSRGGQNS